MKVLFVLAAILLVSSDAFLLGDTFNFIGNAFKAVENAGVKLTKGVVAKGKEVLGKAISSGLQGITNIADATGILKGIGRRDLDAVKSHINSTVSALKSLYDTHGAAIIQSFKEAIAKLKGIFGKLHQNLADGATPNDIAKAVDAVVDDHTKTQNRRFLVSFDDFKAAASTALNAAKDLATSDAAKALAAQAAQAALAAAIGKRSVLSDIGDFFAPHIDTLKDAVSGVGTTLKGHATNLWNAVKGSVTDLGTKLSGHVDKLKEHGSTLLDHGKNALDALKGAVGDILTQTLANVAPAIKGIIATGTDAAGVVTGHAADAVGGAAAASGSF